MVDGLVDEKYEGVVENSEQLARLLLQLKPLGDVEEELALWTTSPKCRCRSGFHYELYIRKTMEDRYEVRPTGFHVGLRSADHYPFDKALAKAWRWVRRNKTNHYNIDIYVNPATIDP